MKYNVLLRPELTVKISGIEADSQQEAIERALEWFDKEGIHKEIRDTLEQIHVDSCRDPCFEYVELSEDTEFALVDEVGDEEFENSNWYTMKGGAWKQWSRVG